MPALIKIVIVVCSLVCCIGCRSPQAKLDRLLIDHPELVQIRPLTVTDTVHLPGAKAIQSIDMADDSITISDLPGVAVTFVGSARGDIVIERMKDTITFAKKIVLPTINLPAIQSPHISGIVTQEPLLKEYLSTIDKVLLAAILLILLLWLFKIRN